MTIELGPIQQHAFALAKTGDYTSSGIILQLVQLIIEKDAELATLRPAAPTQETEAPATP